MAAIPPRINDAVFRLVTDDHWPFRRISAGAGIDRLI